MSASPEGKQPPQPHAPVAAAATGARVRVRWRRRFVPRVAVMLAAVALIPTAGIAAVSVSSAQARLSERHTATVIQDLTTKLTNLLSARVALTDENVATSALTAAHAAGVSPQQVEAIVGIDFLADERAGRAEVDAASAFRAQPLARDLAQLHSLRPAFDSGTLSVSQVTGFFSQFSTDVDNLWHTELVAVRHAAGSASGSARFGMLVDGLDRAFTSWTSALNIMGATNNILTGQSSPANVALFETSMALYNGMTGSFGDHLGAKGTSAWHSALADPATRRFQYVLAATGAVALEGARSPYASNFSGYSAALADGTRWLADVRNVVHAAADDLGDQAKAQEHGSLRALWLDVGFAAGVTVLALLAAAWVSRRVTRPLRSVAASARELAQGRFEVDLCAVGGPSEVADTATAVNDTTAALRALQGYVVTLADDPASPTLDDPLPGPTGRALQKTLDRLRRSMAQAAAHRQQLQELAAHDGLTGLLNRRAAMELIESQLALARRQDIPLMLLFIDLDNLKAINDTYGHDVGDEAIRRVARAFRSTARASDVVARVGGDEFVVSGLVQEGVGDAVALAERIRGSVSGQALEVGEARVTVTCSIGVEVARPGEVLEDVLRQADMALYLAKERGRDQVAWHQAGAPTAGG